MGGVDISVKTTSRPRFDAGLLRDRVLSPLSEQRALVYHTVS